MPGTATSMTNASLTHAHVPHVDFDAEHAGEAHVHDHDQPVDTDQRDEQESG